MMNLKRLVYVLSHWESWHYQLKYIPLYPAWLWFCFRARSVWFFTPSNPTLTFGGFEGETKQEMYRQLPEGTYPKSIFIKPSQPFDEVESMVNSQEFQFPFAVKPDIGMMGFLFRVLKNREELKNYHQMMPVDYIIQELIQYPIEVSVFYYRFPDQQHGTITGFVQKETLHVIGDGKSSLEDLLTELRDRPGFRLLDWKDKYRSRLTEILPGGDVFQLTWLANLSRGAKMINIEKHKDERLLKVFDDLSHHAGHFYYGRYDIKCQSIEDLKNNRNFSILEYNGSGAEPHHIYGNGNNYWQAIHILLHHWDVLFRISRYNHRKGIDYWGFKKGWRYLRNAKKHFRNLKNLDRSYP